MSLLNYVDFINEDFLFEGSSPDVLKKIFTDFQKNLKGRLPELKNFARTEMASELGQAYTGLFSETTYVTVYDTIIKVRAMQGGKIAEYAKDAKKSLDDILNSLIDGKAPTNRFEKAACLVLLLMDEKPEAIFWSPKDSLKKETMALDAIRGSLQKLKQVNAAIHLVLMGELYSGGGNITQVDLEDVDKVPGVPKADFLFVIQSNPPIYISHKDGKSAADFQQYGGLDNLRDHPFAKEFLELIRKHVGDELHGGDEFAIKIPAQHIDLGIRAMFGVDAKAGNKNWSPNNIQLMMQGEMQFKNAADHFGEKFEGAYEVVPTGHQIYNPVLTGGKLQMSETDEYWPYIYVSFRNGQGGSFGFKNARFGIWAQGNKNVQRGIAKWDKLLKK